MIKRKNDIWGKLILIGAVLIIAWAILKSLGILHSPVWIEMLPYLGMGVSLLGVAYKLGKIMSGIEQAGSKVNKLIAMEERFAKVEHEHNLAMYGRLKVKRC
ncbi:MAG: hypothetical protein KJ955_06770 [Nanoarchaeota archaeon]|nr:hypothetical protein [Nanoarchaeota archaeon]